MDKMDGKSMDLTAENIAHIKAIGEDRVLFIAPVSSYDRFDDLVMKGYSKK